MGEVNLRAKEGFSRVGDLLDQGDVCRQEHPGATWCMSRGAGGT